MGNVHADGGWIRLISPAASIYRIAAAFWAIQMLRVEPRIPDVVIAQISGWDNVSVLHKRWGRHVQRGGTEGVAALHEAHRKKVRKGA